MKHWLLPLLALSTSAWADCPDINKSLQDAESDAVSYYLADAQRSLTAAVNGMGCAPVSADQLSRYWQAQAIIWRGSEDDRAVAAFAASRRTKSEVWYSDYGEAAKADWEATTPSTDLVPFSVRGLGDGEQLWLDGAPLVGDTRAGEGYHLLQIHSQGQIRYATVFALTEPTELTVPHAEAVRFEPEALLIRLKTASPAERADLLITELDTIDPLIRPRIESAIEVADVLADHQVEDAITQMFFRQSLSESEVVRDAALEAAEAMVATRAPAQKPAKVEREAIPELTQPPLILTTSQAIELPLPSTADGTFCVQELPGKKCHKIEADGHYKLHSRRPGLVSLNLIWKGVDREQRWPFLYWLERAPPAPGRVSTSGTRDGVEVLLSQFTEDSTWIEHYIVATDKRCEQPVFTTKDHTPLVFVPSDKLQKTLFVCAVDAAGFRSKSVPFKAPKNLRDTQQTTYGEQLSAVFTRHLPVLPPDITHALCLSSRPKCRVRMPSELDEYRLDKREEIQPLWTLVRTGDAIEKSVQNYVVDRRKPEDGEVLLVPYGDTYVLWWSHAFDENSAIKSYRVVAGTKRPRGYCRTGTPIFEGNRGWTIVPSQYTHFRVCAIDYANNISGGPAVEIR